MGLSGAVMKIWIIHTQTKAISGHVIINWTNVRVSILKYVVSEECILSLAGRNEAHWCYWIAWTPTENIYTHFRWNISIFSWVTSLQLSVHVYVINLKDLRRSLTSLLTITEQGLQGPVGVGIWIRRFAQRCIIMFNVTILNMVM